VGPAAPLNLVDADHRGAREPTERKKRGGKRNHRRASITCLKLLEGVGWKEEQERPWFLLANSPSMSSGGLQARRRPEKNKDEKDGKDRRTPSLLSSGPSKKEKGGGRARG